MSVLVGDAIVRARAIAPDPPQAMPAPAAAPTLTAVQLTGGIISGVIYAVLTALNQWGETVASAEANVNVSGANNAFTAGGTVQPGWTRVRLYWGAAAGQEQQYLEIDLVSAGINPGGAFLFTVTTYGAPGYPPTISSALLPDTDGPAIAAARMYDWLNQALARMCVALDGISDISGVPWQSGAAWASLINRWSDIRELWWGGWWQVRGKEAYTWMINPIQSVPGYYTSWVNGGQDVIGLWPQPGSGPASSTLGAAMTATDTQIQLQTDGAANFILPGAVIVEPGTTNAEICLASTPDSTNTYLQGCVRGLGGTNPVAHPINATCIQAIVFFSGQRFAPILRPGQSTIPLSLPGGWEEPLDLFISSKFKDFEQDFQGSQLYMQQFNQAIVALRNAKDPVPKMRQVGDARVYESFLGYRQWYPFGILVP